MRLHIVSGADAIVRSKARTVFLSTALDAKAGSRANVSLRN